MFDIVPVQIWPLVTFTATFVLWNWGWRRETTYFVTSDCSIRVNLSYLTFYSILLTLYSASTDMYNESRQMNASINAQEIYIQEVFLLVRRKKIIDSQLQWRVVLSYVLTEDYSHTHVHITLNNTQQEGQRTVTSTVSVMLNVGTKMSVI